MISTHDFEELKTFLGESNIGHYKAVCKFNDDGDENKIISYSYWQHIVHPKDSIPPDPEQGKINVYVNEDFVFLSSDKEYLAVFDEFIERFPNILIKLRGFKGVNHELKIISVFQDIQAEMTKLLSVFKKKIEFNEHCNVHISNLGLLNINQVGLIEDACTDKVQIALNTGWRILTINPQPDGRRSDYIMGRFNPNESEPNAIRL